MENFTSTGVLTRPSGTTILQILLRNSSPSLQFQTIYIYDWDTGTAVLVSVNNYVIPGNGSNSIEFPLVVSSYSDSSNITLYEVVYGPKNSNISMFSFNISAQS